MSRSNSYINSFLFSSQSAPPSNQQSSMLQSLRRLSHFTTAFRSTSTVATKTTAKMPTTKTFDALIIGSGQSGTPLATALAAAGRKTALIERAHIAGCCVNEGCTPTKTMIASGRVAHLARRGEEYGVGIGGGGKVTVEMEKVRQRKRDIVESFRGGSEKRVQGVEGLEVLMGEARFVGEKTVNVKLVGEGKGEEEVEVRAETIFINTGAKPARPEIEGLESLDPARVLDSTSVMELGDVPEHLIVLGGGYIGLEFGQLFRRLGAKVTVVQRAKQLVPREDAEIAEELKKILEGEGVAVLLETEIQHLAPSTDDEARGTFKASVRHSGDALELTGSHLLLAAGRTPNTDILDPGAAGVEMDKHGYIKVDSRLRTNVAGIFALGDVHGGPAFTHVSYDDFRILRDNLVAPKSKSTPRSVDDRVVPYVMYTDPQLAHVGLHAHEAVAKYGADAVQTASMPMAYVARALETDETGGMMKAVVHKESEKILGFTVLGMEGGEVMSIVQTAMLGGLSWRVLQDAVFAHPTLAESLNNVWGFLK